MASSTSRSSEHEDDLEQDSEPQSKRARQEEASAIDNPESLTTERPPIQRPFYHPDIPTTAHYHVSWMHAGVVTAMAASQKHGYILTGSADGVVKFWKRISVFDSNDEATAGYSTSNQQQQTHHACLEFVKSFTAHTEAVLALAMDMDGDICVSVGADNWLKFYDVSTFDVSTMIYMGSQDRQLGHACCWFQDPVTYVKAVAVASATTGEIYVCDAQKLLQIITLHGSNVVSSMVSIPGRCCVLSTDVKGIIEVWSTASDSNTAVVNAAVGRSGDDTADNNDDEGTSDNTMRLSVGGPCTASRNGIDYASKMDTDLYELVKKKTYCFAAAATADHFVLYCADSKVRVFHHSTGKLLVAFDERLQVYDKTFAQYGLDAMEYGRRAALDRERILTQQHQNASSRIDSQQHVSIQFDPTGKFLLIPTLMGIKVLDWNRRKLMGWIGQADAGSCRFLAVCLAYGDAKINQQLQLARNNMTKTMSMKTSAGDEAEAQDGQAVKKTDALVVALAHEKRRFYVFSHLDQFVVDENNPDASVDDDAIARRDVWNEAPSVEDRLYNTSGHNQGASSENSKTASKAILRTTMGDIHIQLFAAHVPKTIENFVGHARSGYYDGFIFHRVIKGFMLQTGDPLGDGTGGESIWGGEFEDEFVPSLLRHDRPFTVSMANAGPNTNGSQFFITTVPTTWLDNKHTVFGRVVQGMDVCTMIENAKTDDLDKPLEEIRIQNVDLE